MKCLICKSETQTLYRDCKDYRLGLGSGFSIERCVLCGTGYTEPKIPEEELGKFYPSVYENYQARKNILGKYLRRKKKREIEELLKYKTPRESTLFEIGCGNGETLFLARELGFEVYGSDLPGEGIVTAKQNFCIDVTPCAAEKLVFDKKYDVVLMRHSLEHINDPVAVLKNIYENALDDAGVLFLALPRFDSLDHCVMKNFSHVLDMPRHRTHFTKKGLLLLLKNLNFSLIRIYGSEAPSFYFSSYLWKIRHQETFVKKFLCLLASPVYTALFLLSFLKPNCMYVIAKKQAVLHASSNESGKDKISL